MVGAGSGAGQAHAEALPNLGPAALQYCPDCTTPEGGAEVINLFEWMWQQEGGTATLTPPPDPAVPAVYDWAADAQAFMADEEALATASNPSTATTVAGQIANAASDAGLFSFGAEESAAGATLTFGSAVPLFAIGVGGAYLLHKWVLPAIFSGSPDPGMTAPAAQQLQWQCYGTGPGCVTVEQPNHGFPHSPGTAPSIKPPGEYVYWLRGVDSGAAGLQNYQVTGLVSPCGYDAPSTFGHAYALVLDGACANGRPIEIDLATAGDLSKLGGPLKHSATLPAGATALSRPATAPTRTAIATAVSTALNDGAIPGHNLPAWVERVIYPALHGGTVAGGAGSVSDGTTAPADPTVTYATVPNCTGDAYADCVAALQAAGLTVGAHVVLDFNGADVTKPADAVVQTKPAGGASVDVSTPIEVDTNPDPADMPVVLPAPLPGETAADYNARLQTLGLSPYLAVRTATNLDPTKGPNTVIGVSPVPGTRLHPQTAVTIDANPGDAPDPVAVGGPVMPPDIPGVDFTPLNAATPCTTFPFGVPCWMGDALQSWSTSAQPWQFDFPIFNPADGMSKHEIHVDLSILDPALSYIRPVIVAGVTLLLAWAFFSMALGGLGGAGDGSSED